MKFARRYFNYLILFACLVALAGLFFLTLEVDRQVIFSDPNLEAVVRAALDEPLKPLHVSELSKIAELDAPGRGIASLAGIESLPNLTVLNLENNAVQDVSPLAGMRKLRKLNLKNNGLTDLEKANFGALAGVPLRQLSLDYNVVVTPSGQRIWLADVSILGSFTTLTELTLSENRVADISSLSTLVNLKTLVLETNQVQDISALRRMRYLKTLNLGSNDVTDLAPLADLHRLANLYLHGNKNIRALLPLENLSQLRILTLDNVPVGDQAAVLGDKLNLKELSIAGGQLRDISPLRRLRGLTRLNLRDNDIVDLEPLSGLANLRDLDLQSNQNVSSILPLAGLARLEALDLQNVPVGDGVSALAGLKRLASLDARNCAITGTSVLGALMEVGALQNNPKTGMIASLDLRDNPISVAQADGYGPIRDYWENIEERLPFWLPEYAPLAPPVFSASGGYYTEPFDLALTTGLENAAVYYTLDGSEPTQASTRYSAPLAIHNRAGEAGVVSEIKEVSPRWTPPAGEVNKVTVVRARVIDASGLQSPVVTNTFLVDAQKRYTLPVISITTDPANFFDYKYGIYVMGALYDQFAASGSALNPWERIANYTQRGEAWQRPIHIEYFDARGERGFSQDASARIHGAASRERSQKSLRIYAGCDGGCSDTFAYELFPGLSSTATGAPIREFTTFLLRNSGNDWEYTMFRDALAQSLVAHTRLDIQAYQPAVVFLNGEYWGIHNLRERLDQYYVASHYGIAAQDVVILADNDTELTVEAGQAGDEQHYADMLAFVKTHDMADPANYAYIQTLMDVENYIDYQIAEIFVDNRNWPHVNVNLWRKRTEAFAPGAPYGQDGRWRWMVYDTDFSFGLTEGRQASAHNHLLNAINPGWHEASGLLFRSLLDNPQFKASFLRRFADQLNTSFLPRVVLEKIDRMQAAIEPEMPEHIRRWRGKDATLQGWHGSVDVMRYFAETRPQFVREHLIDYFGLGGTVEVRLETDPGMGYIRANTIDIAGGTPGVSDPGAWSGVYFRGMAVELTAVPYPGYRFERWEGPGAGAASSNPLSLTAEQDVSVRAIFAKE